MPSLSQQLFARDQFRRQTAKRQLLEGIAESNRLGAKVKELSRGDYVQQLSASRKLVLVQPRRKYLTSTGIHGLKRRAIARKTWGRNPLKKRRTLAGSGRTGTRRESRLRLGRPHSFLQARAQAGRYHRTTRASQRGFNYEEQAARSSFLGTRKFRDFAPGRIQRTRQTVNLQV